MTLSERKLTPSGVGMSDTTTDYSTTASASKRATEYGTNCGGG